MQNKRLSFTLFFHISFDINEEVKAFINFPMISILLLHSLQLF